MELFSFEAILYNPITFNEKICNCALSLSLRSQKCIKKPILSSHPDDQAYSETLLKDESPPFGFCGLYRVLVLTVTWGTAYSMA